MKTKHIHIVIEEGAHADLRRKAFEEGISMGAYVRRCLLAARKDGGERREGSEAPRARPKNGR
jgi:hypothetical protein